MKARLKFHASGYLTLEIIGQLSLGGQGVLHRDCLSFYPLTNNSVKVHLSSLTFAVQETKEGRLRHFPCLHSFADPDTDCLIFV